jgi:aminomethyltransferase
LGTLPTYSSTLSVLLNERGGIIDDTVITKHSQNAYYVVTNAGCRDKDLAWFLAKIAEWNARHPESEHVEHEVLENWGLVALQGPKSASVLQALTKFDLKQLTFGKSAWVPMEEEGFNLHVARGGYTGEDGFEVHRKEIPSSFSLLTTVFPSWCNRSPYHPPRLLTLPSSCTKTLFN